jgi:hypothetical protein
MAKAPSVFMRATRPHTYHGRSQDEGDVYLALEEDVENIENLKFAKRVPAPPRAVRSAEPPPVAPVDALVEQPAQPVAPLTTASSSPLVQTPRRRGRR